MEIRLNIGLRTIETYNIPYKDVAEVSYILRNGEVFKFSSVFSNPRSVFVFMEKVEDIPVPSVFYLIDDIAFNTTHGIGKIMKIDSGTSRIKFDKEECVLKYEDFIVLKAG